MIVKEEMKQPNLFLSSFYSFTGSFFFFPSPVAGGCGSFSCFHPKLERWATSFLGSQLFSKHAHFVIGDPISSRPAEHLSRHKYQENCLSCSHLLAELLGQSSRVSLPPAQPSSASGVQWPLTPAEPLALNWLLEMVLWGCPSQLLPESLLWTPSNSESSPHSAVCVGVQRALNAQRFWA